MPAEQALLVADLTGNLRKQRLFEGKAQENIERERRKRLFRLQSGGPAVLSEATTRLGTNRTKLGDSTNGVGET